MTRRSMLLPAAALSVVATMLSLSQVFVRQRWLGASLIAVAVAFGIGWVGRRLDVPAVLAPALSVLGLVALLGLLYFPAETAYGIPTASTMRALGETLAQAGKDFRELAAPAEPTDALTILATAGVFLVAMLVDFVVFRIGRPVAAGLPLLALFLIPTSLASKPNVFAFVLAAAGYLTLLVAEGRDRARGWGRRLSGLNVLDELGDVSHVSRIGRRIGTAAIGLAIVAPLAMPEVGDGLFAGGRGPFGRNDGPTTKVVVNPIVAIQGQLRDLVTRELFTVTTTEPAYLRMTSLEVFDGQEWSIAQHQADHRIGDGDLPDPADAGEVAHVTGNYDITIGPLDVDWLPVPYLPRRVDVNGDWRFDRRTAAVFSARNTSSGVTYHAVSEIPDPTPAQLQRGGTLPRGVGRYLDVPKNTPAKAQAVLKQVTGGKTTQYDKALALQTYFRDTGGFTYTLDVPRGTSKDALTEFLDRKSGYCEQFAATMAYLARLAGIPARVAVGFTPGNPRADGTFLVTNKDAHAWPELYFAEVGWVRFEPTPRDSSTRPPSYAVVSTPTTPASPNPSTSAAPSAQPSATPSRARGAGEAAETETVRGRTLPNAVRRALPDRIPVVPLVLVLLVVGVLTPATVAAATRRRRRARAGGHVGRIGAAWAALADAAEDTGHPLRAAASPRAAAPRLVAAVELDGAVAAEVRRLATAEERARYAPAVDPADGLDASVRLVRRALRASLPRGARWRATAFPPSALRRIREWFATTGERIDRAQAAFWHRLGTALRRRSA